MATTADRIASPAKGNEIEEATEQELKKVKQKQRVPTGSAA